MRLCWHSSITKIPADDWNNLSYNTHTPLLTHEWLAHIEASCNVHTTGTWQPMHLTVHTANTLIAAMPLYLRAHSTGEFIFDFAFADIAAQLGKAYYPKLIGMSPLTPCTAFCPLVEAGREDELTEVLTHALYNLCTKHNIPVLQYNFVLPSWKERMEQYGMITWEHHAYVWRNDNYRSFDDYLACFHKGQRHNIRRERTAMERAGIQLRMVPAAEAPDSYFSCMAAYYRKTNQQFGPYAANFLTPRFFTQMPHAVRKHVWFSAALQHNEPEPLALAMLLRKDNTMLGRYWGCRDTIKHLHFNVCYYTPHRMGNSRANNHV